MLRRRECRIMATFEFQAKTDDGRMVRGELEASNEAEARIRMRAQRLTPVRIDPKKGAGGGFTTAEPGRRVGQPERPAGVHPSVRVLSARSCADRAELGGDVQGCAQPGDDRGAAINLGRRRTRTPSGRCARDEAAGVRSFVHQFVRAGEEGGVLETCSTGWPFTSKPR